MPAELPIVLLAGLLCLCLFLYFVFGGADFGGGVWDLLAGGPRKAEQRAWIKKAIGPVWEANHVWLIFAVVFLFSAFPRAFAAISIALHVPLTLFLLGVIFRGCAFVFGTAPTQDESAQGRWGRVFAIASLVAPVLLGMCVGALASGDIRVIGTAVSGGFFAPWLQPFPLVIGLFSLVLCAFVAATFLSFETRGLPLEEDFRKRALISGVVVGVIAALAIWVSRSGAPVIFADLTQRPSAWLLHAATGVAALTGLGCLFRRRYGAARIAVVAQVGLILTGWVLSQMPYLVVPDLTVANAAGHPSSRSALLWATLIGAPILLPSLYLLFKVFKPNER